MRQGKNLKPDSLRSLLTYRETQCIFPDYFKLSQTKMNVFHTVPKYHIHGKINGNILLKPTLNLGLYFHWFDCVICY